ncbi:MAG: YdcF family protein [Gammaproteobacteria bacterium]
MALRIVNSIKHLLLVGVLLLLVTVSLSEAAYWYGYRSLYPIKITGDCVVLVLGYPTESDGTPHPVQTIRVRAGVSAYSKHQCSHIIFSGGAVRNRHIEAETMAKVAQDRGVPESNIVIEGRSRTTWENLGCPAPYLKKAKRVVLVSDSLHVHRAKAYACRQNVSLCSKVFEVGVNPPAMLFWWKVPAAAHELQSRIWDALFYRRSQVKNDSLCPER